MTRRSTLLVSAVLVAACGTVDVSPRPPTSTAVPATTPEPVQVGAQLRVRLEGASACEGGYACTARLGVLPDGTEIEPGTILEPSVTDAIWQTASGPGVTLVAPPDGDLPVLAPGAHVIVWSVTARRIASDPPSAPAELASRCSTQVQVDPGTAVVTMRIDFEGGSTLAPGSAGCSMDQVVESDATPAPTPAGIQGVVLTPTAMLPSSWRSVPTPRLDGLDDPGFRVTLGVAPDGAFIAIPSGGERPSLPVLRSVDGETWTNVGVLPASKDGWTHHAAWNDQVIIVTGGSSDESRPALWVSADGIDWAAIGAPDTGGLYLVDALAANSAGFVATQLGASGIAPWIGAPDGGKWDRVGSLTPTLDAWIVDVTASDGGFVAVGSDDSAAGAWVSADGLAWTPAAIADGTGVILVSVAARGQGLVAFGQGPDPLDDPLLFVSDDDGRSWARMVGGRLPPSNWPPVQAVADGFIATDSGVWTSRDGVDWDDAAWTDAVSDAVAIRLPSVAASGTRIVAAAMPDGGGSPLFWIGATNRP